MSTSYTTTETFTRTNARHLASKVASDLKLMQHYYGKPSDESIEQYLEEVIVLLLEDCLESVTYGYQRDGKWIVALDYKVRAGSIETTDSRSGGVKAGLDISGATWGSYLIKNSKYTNLTYDEKQRIKSMITLERTDSDEPKYSESGSWVTDTRNYYSGGVGLNRKIFIPN